MFTYKDYVGEKQACIFDTLHSAGHDHGQMCCSPAHAAQLSNKKNCMSHDTQHGLQLFEKIVALPFMVINFDC